MQEGKQELSRRTLLTYHILVPRIPQNHCIIWHEEILMIHKQVISPEVSHIVCVRFTGKVIAFTFSQLFAVFVVFTKVLLYYYVCHLTGLPLVCSPSELLFGYSDSPFVVLRSH